MAEVKLFGYCNNISVRPGDEQTVHVTADGTDTAEAQLVRLIHGDQHPDGPGFIEEEVDCEINGAWQVKKQYTQVGSYLQGPDPDKRLCIDGSFSMFAYIWPDVGSLRFQQVLDAPCEYTNIGIFSVGIDFVLYLSGRNTRYSGQCHNLVNLKWLDTLDCILINHRLTPKVGQ